MISRQRAVLNALDVEKELVLHLCLFTRREGYPSKRVTLEGGLP